MSQNDQNYEVNWEKNWLCKNNDTLNLWRNDATWIILQEVVGLQSYQNIVVNFNWLTTLMPSSCVLLHLNLAKRFLMKWFLPENMAFIKKCG